MAEFAVLQKVQEMEWLDGIPANKAQEWLSLAYLQAIIAQAGLNIGHVEWDDGIDLQVGASKRLGGLIPRNHYIALQVKCSSVWSFERGNIVFDLSQKAYDELRDKSTMRQYLVLHTLPNRREHWLGHTDTFSVIHRAAYWYDLSGLPNNTNTKSTRIKIPGDQILTARAIRKLVVEAVEP